MDVAAVRSKLYYVGDKPTHKFTLVTTAIKMHFSTMRFVLFICINSTLSIRQFDKLYWRELQKSRMRINQNAFNGNERDHCSNTNYIADCVPWRYSVENLVSGQMTHCCNKGDTRREFFRLKAKCVDFLKCFITRWVQYAAENVFTSCSNILDWLQKSFWINFCEMIRRKPSGKRVKWIFMSLRFDSWL